MGVKGKEKEEGEMLIKGKGGYGGEGQEGECGKEQERGQSGR